MTRRRRSSRRSNLSQANRQPSLEEVVQRLEAIAYREETDEEYIEPLHSERPVRLKVDAEFVYQTGHVIGSLIVDLLFARRR